jgi:hypothetical protein
MLETSSSAYPYGMLATKTAVGDEVAARLVEDYAFKRYGKGRDDASMADTYQEGAGCQE